MSFDNEPNQSRSGIPTIIEIEVGCLATDEENLDLNGEFDNGDLVEDYQEELNNGDFSDVEDDLEFDE